LRCWIEVELQPKQKQLLVSLWPSRCWGNCAHKHLVPKELANLALSTGLAPIGLPLAVLARTAKHFEIAERWAIAVAGTTQKVPGLGHDYLTVPVSWPHVAGERHQLGKVRLRTGQLPREDRTGQTDCPLHTTPPQAWVEDAETEQPTV